MGKVTLITGAARSGKSDYALALARRIKGKKAFIATAAGLDDEMKERIRNHRRERGADFETIEETLDLRAALRRVRAGTKAAVLDCLTVWLGNLYHEYHEDEKRIRKSIDALAASLRKLPYALFIVTNEVGWSIVPENALARKFRDMSGYMNKKIAANSDRVDLCVCGIPVKIK
jgi:adenosylcobinamide kinase / adenosylcobinamide-phosphate guanylyltransferase